MSKGTLYILLVVVALLCIYMVSLPNPPENFIINDIKKKLILIDPRFKDLDIRESNASYSEDKSIIYLCLRDENQQPYDLNTILYVALHEVSYVLNKKSYGHDQHFHEMFDKLLCLAAKKGVYDPNAPHPDTYCQVDIRGITFPSSCARNINLDDDEHFTVIAEKDGHREF